MPDESCRTCGLDLDVFLKCAECRQPSQFICNRCERTTLHQFHLNCNLEKQLCFLHYNNFWNGCKKFIVIVKMLHLVNFKLIQMIFLLKDLTIAFVDIHNQSY